MLINIGCTEEDGCRTDKDCPQGRICKKIFGNIWKKYDGQPFKTCDCVRTCAGMPISYR